MKALAVTAIVIACAAYFLWERAPSSQVERAPLVVDPSLPGQPQERVRQPDRDPSYEQRMLQDATTLFVNARARGEWRPQDESEFFSIMSALPPDAAAPIALAHFEVVAELVKPLPPKFE